MTLPIIKPFFFICRKTDSEETDTASEDTSPEFIPPKKNNSSKNNPKSNLDLLLDLSDIGTTAPVMAPSLNEFSNHVIESPLQIVQPVCINSKSIELLNRINGNGLSAEYRFTRTPHLYSAKMANLNVTFRNNTNDLIEDIKLAKKVC